MCDVGGRSRGDCGREREINNLQGVSYVMVGCLFVFVFVVSVHTHKTLRGRPVQAIDVVPPDDS